MAHFEKYERCGERKRCYVKTINGYQMLFMPDGTQVPLVIMTRVIQDADKHRQGLAECFVKLLIEVE